ncbi:MAG: hypothetical protein HY326_04910 [Chloroflexi bacterium]|nr:hypothetical protein [Chloroflexota bacterium]
MGIPNQPQGLPPQAPMRWGSSIPERAKKNQLFARAAHVLLWLMALVAIWGAGASVSNYLQSVRSRQDLKLEVNNLQFYNDENPRVNLRFHLTNDSDLPIQVESYRFELYLNHDPVGSSYSTYTGTDPATTIETMKKAAIVNRKLDPHQEMDLQFTVYIYAKQMEIVRKAQETGSWDWSTNAIFSVVLPYSRGIDAVLLSAQYQD